MCRETVERRVKAEHLLSLFAFEEVINREKFYMLICKILPLFFKDIFLGTHARQPVWNSVWIWPYSAGLSSVTHFAWFSRIYFKTRIHARIEQFVSFATHFPISKQIFETEFENQKNIRFRVLYCSSVHACTFCRCYTCIICVTD